MKWVINVKREYLIWAENKSCMKNIYIKKKIKII